MDKFYAIRCFSKYCDYNRYLATDDKGIPCLTYVGLDSYPAAVKQFESPKAAQTYLQSILLRTNIDTSSLSISQRLELMRVSNNTKYYLLKCYIDQNGELITETSKLLSEFSKD
jgi:hypothetical protein